jgi:hypothetical protein
MSSASRRVGTDRWRPRIHLARERRGASGGLRKPSDCVPLDPGGQCIRGVHPSALGPGREQRRMSAHRRGGTRSRHRPSGDRSARALLPFCAGPFPYLARRVRRQSSRSTCLHQAWISRLRRDRQRRPKTTSLRESPDHNDVPLSLKIQYVNLRRSVYAACPTTWYRHRLHAKLLAERARTLAEAFAKGAREVGRIREAVSQCDLQNGALPVRGRGQVLGGSRQAAGP